MRRLSDENETLFRANFDTANVDVSFPVLVFQIVSLRPRLARCVPSADSAILPELAALGIRRVQPSRIFLIVTIREVLNTTVEPSCDTIIVDLVGASSTGVCLITLADRTSKRGTLSAGVQMRFRLYKYPTRYTRDIPTLNRSVGVGCSAIRQERIGYLFTDLPSVYDVVKNDERSVWTAIEETDSRL